jgi:hypothetical protein
MPALLNNCYPFRVKNKLLDDCQCLCIYFPVLAWGRKGIVLVAVENYIYIFELKRPAATHSDSNPFKQIFTVLSIPN